MGRKCASQPVKISKDDLDVGGANGKLRLSLNKQPWGAFMFDTAPLQPLQSMDEGDWVDVAEVRGDSAWISRLAELGIAAGRRLQILRRGTPCLLQLGSSRVSLRPGAASQILVRRVVLTD
jgi:Fe2+ transport system protein FeoA